MDQPLYNLSQRMRIAQGLTPDPSPVERAEADARAARRDALALQGADGRPLGPELSYDDLRLPDGTWPNGVTPPDGSR